MSPTILSYPGGRPGVALLLLRIAASGALIVCGARDAAGSLSWARAIGFVALASGVLLLAGVLTTWAGALGAAAAAATLFPWPGAAPVSVPGGPAAALLTAAVATALSLAGPGAYSFDARLFGRREILIPQSSRLQC